MRAKICVLGLILSFSPISEVCDCTVSLKEIKKIQITEVPKYKLQVNRNTSEQKFTLNSTVYL